jgi:hypothetical protein
MKKELGVTMVFHMPKYYDVHINESNGYVKIFSNSKHAKGRELSQYINRDGYLRCKINNKHTMIHHLVAKFFICERPIGLVINHIDGNKVNNAPSNLEYVTQAENISHSIKTGLHICNRVEKMGKYIDASSLLLSSSKNIC